jgi:hypothetical protein
MRGNLIFLCQDSVVHLIELQSETRGLGRVGFYVRGEFFVEVNCISTTTITSEAGVRGVGDRTVRHISN